MMCPQIQGFTCNKFSQTTWTPAGDSGLKTLCERMILQTKVKANVLCHVNFCGHKAVFYCPSCTDISYFEDFDSAISTLGIANFSGV